MYIHHASGDQPRERSSGSVLGPESLERGCEFFKRLFAPELPLGRLFHLGGDLARFFKAMRALLKNGLFLEDAISQTRCECIDLSFFFRKLVVPRDRSGLFLRSHCQMLRECHRMQRCVLTCSCSILACIPWRKDSRFGLICFKTPRSLNWAKASLH